MPVNPMFRLAELEHELTDADVAAVVTLESLYPWSNSLRPDLPSLRAVFTTTIAQLPAEPTLSAARGIADFETAEPQPIGTPGRISYRAHAEPDEVASIAGPTFISDRRLSALVSLVLMRST